MRRFVPVLLGIAAALGAWWLFHAPGSGADDAAPTGAIGSTGTGMVESGSRLAGRGKPEAERRAEAAKAAAAEAAKLAAAKPKPKESDTVAAVAALRAKIPIQQRIEDTQRLLEQSRNAADRAAMDRLLRRFLTGKDGGNHWTDGPVGALARIRAQRTKTTDPLPIADEEESEKRRLEELENLQRRDAVGLLDSIEAALAWLAIHQSADGSFSDVGAKARCVELGHDPRCVVDGKGDTSGAFATAATGLAVLAFLDFRDQDVRALFEPSLASGIAWLLKQQNPDGSFRAGGQLYASAIALMAISEAAASSGRDDLRQAAAQGLDVFARNAGRLGGYRYNFGLDGDLSVSAWVAQAVEQARAADLVIPWKLVDNLGSFLKAVWKGGVQFSYVAEGGRDWWLTPAGILMGLILWEPDEARDAVWNQWLLKPEYKSRPYLYTLYYGVRLAIRASGGLPNPWRGWVFEIANAQAKDKNLAGSFPEGLDARLDRGGLVVRTAFAALTMEHALYLR
jgi:hypothetical protein